MASRYTDTLSLKTQWRVFVPSLFWEVNPYCDDSFLIGIAKMPRFGDPILQQVCNYFDLTFLTIWQRYTRISESSTKVGTLRISLLGFYTHCHQVAKLTISVYMQSILKTAPTNGIFESGFNLAFQWCYYQFFCLPSAFYTEKLAIALKLGLVICTTIPT